LCSLPYIFYILMYSKTKNVIKNLNRINIEHINHLQQRGMHLMMEKDSHIVSIYQYWLMESTDQFADLLDYITFKEAQTEIIHFIGETLRYYIIKKQRIPSQFFELTNAIRMDSTFRTYVENQYQELENRKTFYEVKIFRMLGNAYIRKINDDEFELASLIASELASTAKLALQEKQDDIIKDIIIRFNTLMRFAIKHATRHNEARNLYNLAFHYSTVIQAFIEHDQKRYLKQCCFYLKYYGNELYRYADSNYALYFIVDTLTAELKKIAVLLSDKQWGQNLQEEVLDIILQMDNPPDYSKDTLDQSVNNGVRILQIGLALHYLKSNHEDFAKKIILDSLEDLAYIDEKTYLLMLEKLYNRIRVGGPSFWEDTDRGNTNIYFSPDADQIEKYSSLVHHQMKKQLSKLQRSVSTLKDELKLLRKEEGPLTAEKQERILAMQERIANRRKTFFQEGLMN
jgi:hypothetical protein